MRWLLCAPVLACPSVAALSAAALAQGGHLVQLALVLAMTLAAHDAARTAQDCAPMPRLLRRLAPCGPYLPGAAPGAGWLFGQAQDGTALATMVLCTLLATLALLPAYHALVCTPEAF
ncbi:MAG: hypothetical protein GYB53_17755 [Rhodobacteraceae bacterium]|nr:hypothetical protein [Paracoccaceae bacterium]MBR9822643.1 hypothetical protein [Paracoccaceae bacterium]